MLALPGTECQVLVVLPVKHRGGPVVGEYRKLHRCRVVVSKRTQDGRRYDVEILEEGGAYPYGHLLQNVSGAQLEPLPLHELQARGRPAAEV